MYNAKEIIVSTFCAHNKIVSFQQKIVSFQQNTASNSEVCLKFLKTAMIEKERTQKKQKKQYTCDAL